MASNFRLDHAGIAEILKGAAMRSLIDSTTSSIASQVSHTTSSGESIPVRTESYTTDRAAGAVTLAHPAGQGVEAKYGLLTRAAAAVGLEVSKGPAGKQLVDYTTKSGKKRKATAAQVANWTRGAK